MKYIKIKNQGVIEPQALHLIGASTKTNDSTKIGQFGSGNKYALAFFLRENYEMFIYAGLDEMKISTIKETFRDQVFQVIHIDSVRTSITTQMGKDWKLWQAMRELYCNALDEGSVAIEFVQDIKPVADETHFYIATRPEIKQFITDFDNYFSTNKEVLFECSVGKIVEKSGTLSNIYRKGIRCFNTKQTSSYDYDFNYIDIDENRLVRYPWQVDEMLWDMVSQCTDEEVILNILLNSNDLKFLESGISDISTIRTDRMSEEFKRCIRKTNLAPSGYAGLLKVDEIHKHVIIPTKIFKAIRGTLKDENVGDNFKISRNGAMFRILELAEIPELHRRTLADALSFFEEVKFIIPYGIDIAIFDDKEVMGSVNDGKILISDICLDAGVNEVANTIIEEFIHIKHSVADETRAFQTALITEFIVYMKNNNAIVI